MGRPRKTTTATPDTAAVAVATAPKRRPYSVAVRKRLGDPFKRPQRPIPMRDPDLTVRSVNAALRDGRIDELRDLGWEVVEPADLKGTPEDHGYRVQDGRVVRGERGQTVLMKMHKDDYAAIQAAKARRNLADMGGKRGKDKVLDEVARKLGAEGDQAASYLSRAIEVVDERGPEPELEAAMAADRPEPAA
jgi:hypothetical protein